MAQLFSLMLPDFTEFAFINFLASKVIHFHFGARCVLLCHKLKY